ANALAFEAHLADCAECAAEFKRLQALRSRLRAPGVAFEAPAALRARIATVVSELEADRALGDSGAASRLARDASPSRLSGDASASPLGGNASESPSGDNVSTGSFVSNSSTARRGDHRQPSLHVPRPRRAIFAWTLAGSVTALAAALALVFFYVP